MTGPVPATGAATRERIVPSAARRLHADPSDVMPVAVMPASPEALLFGVVLGAFSSLLLVLTFRLELGDILTSFPTACLFLSGWLGACWFLTRETGRVLVVLRQGFLLGALQWGMLTTQASRGALVFDITDRSTVSHAIDGLITGGLATTMLWICVVGCVCCWLGTRSPYRELGTDRI